MQNQQLVDFLKECGVCEICQLRYLKARGTEYKDVRGTFERLGVKCEDLEDSGQYERVAKKPRLAVCPTCLDLFSAEFQTELINGILGTEIRDFECDKVVVAISLPIMLQTRQLSMWYALIRKFGKDVNTDRAPDVPLKEAVKLIINPIICEQLQKQYDVNGLMINVTLSHTEEKEELESLRYLNEAGFPAAPNGRRQEISRALLEKQYVPNRLNAKVFEQFIPIPPKGTANGLSLESVVLTGPTVFVAGRYRKITRELSHTPWVLNGKRIMKDSIEEILIRSVAPYFCADQNKVIFMSSGREDVDVRCLGKGRPFVLEIPNARRTSLPRKVAHQMESEIDGSGTVSVRNLQIVKREDLVHIKSGEESKRKYYRALCALQQPASVGLLEKLDLPQGFEIKQKTPIRVLHRRPLHTRPRSIYSLKAFVDRKDHRVLVLDIVSQAGTYIKELIHGEFGRTKPCVASLIGQPIDILALDVMAIDLDWPHDVDNSVLT